jgi:predicted metal-dependent HD superfamily phosphohydrolase
MMDINMSIFGSHEQRYFNYHNAIRQEYSHYTQDTYNQKRKEFLIRQQVKKIFYTPEYQVLEDQAHKNIESELATLS